MWRSGEGERERDHHAPWRVDAAACRADRLKHNTLMISKSALKLQLQFTGLSQEEEVREGAKVASRKNTSVQVKVHTSK